MLIIAYMISDISSLDFIFVLIFYYKYTYSSLGYKVDSRIDGSKDNSQAFSDAPLYSEKLTIRYACQTGGIIAPYAFKTMINIIVKTRVLDN